MQTTPALGFEAIGLSSCVLAALQRAGLVTPTPIQSEAIPLAMAGQDLIGIAQTGTGKTLAFGLPILEQLLTGRCKKALIVVPTRELALQVEESIKNIGRFLPRPPRSASLIGGEPIYRQIRQLQGQPSLIIATPGRLRDHLERKSINLDNVGILVLDEADRMLDMGFAPQIKLIITSLPAQRQTMLFSATMPPEIASLAANYLKNPVRVEVAKSGSNNNLIKQELCYVSHDKKTDILSCLLSEHKGTALVFSRTKHGATKLAKKVQAMGHSAAEIHSNRSLNQRRQALDGFKSGRYRVLVATDVASRGIDVPDIGVVINYDLPEAAEDYVHRIGRTGRANTQGLAISLATPDQTRDVTAIERLMQKTLALSVHSEPRPAFIPRAMPSGNYRPNQNRSFSSNRGQQRPFRRGNR